MDNKYYKKAIEVLMSKPISHENIVMMLARDYPSIFLDITGYGFAPDEPPLPLDMYISNNEEEELRRIVNYVLNNDVITSIKAIREQYGFGLKEAKDVIDSFIGFLQRTQLNAYIYSEIAKANRGNKRDIKHNFDHHQSRVYKNLRYVMEKIGTY